MAKSMRREQKMHYGEDGEVCRLITSLCKRQSFSYLSFIQRVKKLQHSNTFTTWSGDKERYSTPQHLNYLWTN